MKAITIWTCRQVNDEPDKHDAYDGYEDMPNVAFRSLKKVLAYVHEDMMVEFNEMLEGESKEEQERMRAEYTPVSLEHLTKMAEIFFKSEPNGDFTHVTTTCSKWIICPLKLS